MTVLVSIIIPHLVTTELVKECVEQIYDNTDYSNFEVIVCDDGTHELANSQVLIELQNKFNLTLIMNSEHRGFGQNCDSGARLAKGEYLIFFSTDIRIPDSKWLTKIIKYFQENPNVGCLTPRQEHSKKPTVYFEGTHMDNGVVKHINYGRSINNIRDTQETFTCNGACMCMPTKVYFEAGGFDKRFTGFGIEDCDLSLSIKAKGYTLIYLSDPTMIHFEEATRGCIGAFGNLGPNRELFDAKWGLS